MFSLGRNDVEFLDKGTDQEEEEDDEEESQQKRLYLTLVWSVTVKTVVLNYCYCCWTHRLTLDR